MKIGAIFNPNAGRAKRYPGLASELERILAPQGPYLITRNLEEIPAAVEKIVSHGPDILAICGGDGTLYHTLSPFFRLNGTQKIPLIAILKGGTTNTLLKSVGSSEKPVGFAKKLVEKIQGRRVFEIVEFDAMKVNEGYGFFTGAAMVAKIIAAYLKGGDVGTKKAVSLIFRCIGSALTGGSFGRELSTPVIAEGTIDGQPIPINSFTLLLAGTAPTIGFGLKPTARGHERPGYFHLLASSRSAAYIALQVPLGMLGLPLQGKGHLQGLFTRLELTFSQPEPYIVDGEPLQTRTLLVETGPRLKIIRG